MVAVTAELKAHDTADGWFLEFEHLMDCKTHFVE